VVVVAVVSAVAMQTAATKATADDNLRNFHGGDSRRLGWGWTAWRDMWKDFRDSLPANATGQDADTACTI
jgi:hypothetical protein